MMRYGSVCSGVEAASLAWKPLGWEPAFFAEVEPFPCAVLQQKFGATKPLRPLDPNDTTDKKERKTRENWLRQIKRLPDGGTIPNLGDFTKIKESDYHGQIDLLVGGTPCQDLSLAGKRAGFDGKRSSLAIDFVRLAYELGCKWVVWENVPGTLSSHNGRDFATLLSLFTGCAIEVPKQGFDTAGFVCPARRDRYGVAWRVLDARFVRTPRFPRGIPQRRRRLFLVGYFGDWTRPAKILLDCESLRGNPAAIGSARPTTAADPEKSIANWWDGSEFAGTIMRTGSKQRMPGKGRFQAVIIDKHTCKSFGHAPALEREGTHELICFHGSQDPICSEDHANAIGRNQGQENCMLQTVFPTIDSNICKSLNLQDNNKYIAATSFAKSESQIRRLTPVECERLMGFPDNHPQIKWNGKPAEECPDGPRYKACGNSMCVNCMEWIGIKINTANITIN